MYTDKQTSANSNAGSRVCTLCTRAILKYICKSVLYFFHHMDNSNIDLAKKKLYLKTNIFVLRNKYLSDLFQTNY